MKKGLLYKGYTIQPYSPAAGTGLSSHELNQPGTYQDVKDTSMTAMFKVEGTENDFFLAWTTTPWTLPANNGLAVGAGIEYVKVKTFNQYTFEPINVILAKDRLSSYFSDKAKEIKLEDYQPNDKLIPYEVVESFKGRDLAGKSYEQLMPYIPLEKPAFTVVIGDFVTTQDGTGIVHISKTFGADDYRVSVMNNMPGVFVKDEEGKDVPIVNKQGKYVAEITDFAGMYVKNEYYSEEERPEKSLDVLISIKLKEENRAFKVEKYEHSYPHCWRTDKPILYYPLDSWFIKTTAYKDQMVALNKTINWKPASTGLVYFFDQTVQSRKNPTITFWPFVQRNFSILKSEAIQIRIKRKESIGILKCSEEPSLYFAYSFNIEFEVVPRVCVRNHVPTCGIRTKVVDRFKWVDGIAQTFRHFIAAFVEHQAVGDYVFESYFVF